MKVSTTIKICLYFLIFLNVLNNVKGKTMSIIKITSNNFENNQTLPIDQTCDGRNISPQLSWGNVPTATKSFSIICDDPDAPSRTWVHWVIFNIPAQETSLAEHVTTDKQLANGALQGINDFGKIGYGGACPPQGHGTHRYFFKIYALDTKLDLQPGITKQELEQAMQGHILATGELVGIYSRK